jgi:hypothetical protein
MTTPYEDRLWREQTDAFARAQAASPKETVAGVIFQRALSERGYDPEYWHVWGVAGHPEVRIGSSLSGGQPLHVVNRSHEHQGSRFTGWGVSTQKGELYPTRREAMQAAARIVLARLHERADALERQTREVREQIRRIEMAS